MSRQKENVIREKRTIEANKKNLMGPSGKFGIILQAFGTPVIRQGSSLMDQSFLDDPFGDDVETEYAPTLSGGGPVTYRDEILTSSNDYVYNEGLMFDGLSRGMHLEIVYWHAESKLKVSYKGYPVYLEVAGELEGYAPFNEWEQMIDKLYRVAKDRIKVIKQEQEDELAEKVQYKKKAFWQNLRLKWGI